MTRKFLLAGLFLVGIAAGLTQALQVQADPALILYREIADGLVRANRHMRVIECRVGQPLSWSVISHDPEVRIAYAPVFADKDPLDETGANVHLIAVIYESSDGPRASDLAGQTELTGLVWDGTDLEETNARELSAALPQLDLEKCRIINVGASLPDARRGRANGSFGLVAAVVCALCFLATAWFLVGELRQKFWPARYPTLADEVRRQNWQAIGRWTAFAFVPAFMVFLCLIAGPSLAQTLHSQRTPQEISCSALAASGPGSNAYARLNGFRPDSARSAGWEALPDRLAPRRVYVPLVPVAEDGPRGPAQAPVVLLTHSVRDEQQIDELLSPGFVYGHVRPPMHDPILELGDRDDGVALARLLPGVDPRTVWIVTHDVPGADGAEVPAVARALSLVMPAVLLLGGGWLSILPLGFSILRRRGAGLPAALIGALLAAAGIVFFVMNPRGSLDWNTYAPGVALLGTALGSGLVVWAGLRLVRNAMGDGRAHWQPSPMTPVDRLVAVAEATRFRPEREAAATNAAPGTIEERLLLDAAEIERLVAQEFPETAAASSLEQDDNDGHPLGRRLSEFDKYNEWMAGILLAVTGGLYLAAVWNVPIDFVWKIGGGLIPILATCGLCEILPGGKDRFQHHERGLALIGPSRRRELPFDELDSFTAKWVECYHNGVYAGTNVDLTFYSQRTVDPLRFLVTFRRGNPDEARLVALIDRAGEIVATRLREELDRAGRVKWTDRLAIRKEAIEHRERADAEPVLIPFPSICGWSIEDGNLRIWFGDEPRLATESTAAENFYGGLPLARELLAARSLELKPDALARHTR